MNELSTEIKRIEDAKTAIKTAIEAKGVPVGNGTIDTYASKIDAIQTGGSSTIYLKDYPEIKFGWSTFTELPACFNLSGLTNIDGLFKNTSLNIIPKTVGLVVSAKNAFENSQLFNLNGTNFYSCTDFTGCFKNCMAIKKIDGSDYPSPSGNPTDSTIFMPSAENLKECFCNCKELVMAVLQNIRPKNFNSTFLGCSKLDTAHIDASVATSLQSCFEDCTQLYKVTINHTSTALTQIDNIFKGCKNLTSSPDFECQNLENNGTVSPFGSFYNELPNLINCGAFLHLTLSLDLSPLTNATKESIVRVFREVGDVSAIPETRTITLSKTVYELLTPDEQAIATGKGWTLASN